MTMIKQYSLFSLKQKSARKIHRFLGVFIAIGLIYITLTGTLLNHSESLKLDQQIVSNPLVLKWYQLEPPQIKQAIKLDQNWLVQLDSNLFWNQTQLPLSGNLYSSFKHQILVYAIIDQNLSLLTEQGEWIDTVVLPKDITSPDQVEWLVNHNTGLVSIRYQDKTWQINEDLTGFISLKSTSGFIKAKSLTSKEIPPKLKESLLQQNGSLNWERVMVDLHNGYFFGSIGPYLLDLFALLLLIMIVSGLRLLLK